jgi:hypothetical protein
MKTLFLLIILLFTLPSFSQTVRRSCSTHEVLQEQKRLYPAIKDNIERIERHTQEVMALPQVKTRSGVITIPVVVHVIYRSSNPIENITEEQILSQLNVLNKDYRRLNSDIKSTPSVFMPFSADCELEFKLAKRNPEGKATTGIMRYPTDRKVSWGKSDEVKITEKGGVAPWDASKYLNLYVCAIGGGILGYSSMPGSLAIFDGVVIDYRYFGTMGTAVSPFNLGRTTTHEIGHWLNLRHTWGDNDCGDDLISDTPVQQGPNYGCVTFPHITCSGDSKGDMFMNFMDYTDDACMNIFSAGQKKRIQTLFSFGGARASLLNSDALIAVSETLPLEIGCTDVYESNNTFTTAKEISANSSISAQIGALGDNDYFIIRTTETERNIQIQLSELPFDYDVKLYNSQRQLLGTSSRSNNTDEKIVLNNAPINYYYVRVYPNKDFSTTQCYKLTIQTSSISFAREIDKIADSRFKDLEKIQVYPNPSIKYAQVEINTNYEGAASIFILDITGKTILSKFLNINQVTSTFQLDVTGLSNGFYTLMLKTGNEIQTKRMMVMKSF